MPMSSLFFLAKNVTGNMLVCFVCLMVFNATFNNISVISWRSVLLVEEIGELEKKSSCTYIINTVDTDNVWW